MIEEERKNRSIHLKNLLDSPGGDILFRHIEEEMRDGWDTFIGLPVLQKTSKLALNHQARYDVLKGIKEWINSEIKLGE